MNDQVIKTNVQIIEKDGQPEWAVIPYSEYEQLLADAEMAVDIRAYDAAHQMLENGLDEFVPQTMVDTLLDGANPIRVWREYRAITRTDLANKAGISSAYLSQLETGKRTGSAEVINRIASILNITVDDLL